MPTALRIPTPSIRPRAARARSARRRAGFSLVETSIALSILGIGLLMLAALFPVAMTQHRRSADHARALDLAAQAKALLHNRLNAEALWFDGALFSDGFDSPWNLLPMANIRIGAAWLDLSDPTAQLNGRSPLPPGFSELQLVGPDVLSDPIVPASDAEAARAANRLVWYGFYRQMADGSKSFAAAICKQRRDQVFLRQLVDTTLPADQRFLDPLAVADQPFRLPVPWRVTVFPDPATGRLLGAATATIGLARLAPRGTKILVHGAPVPGAPAGRVLTVSEIDGPNAVRVLEDLSDAPSDFDVWIFPPAIGAKDSPLIAWKVSL